MEVIDLATRLPIGSVQPDIEGMTILNAYSQHLRSRNLAHRTIKLRLSHARELATLPPPSVDDLEAWVNPLTRRLAAETIKSRRASARSFFGWLHATGRAPADPSAELRPVKVPYKMPRVIPDPDFSRALMQTTTPQVRAAILLARYACLRLSEIAHLHTSDRTGDSLLIHGKGGKERIVYLGPELDHALTILEREQGHGYYFPGRFTGHVHKDALHKIIKRNTGYNPHALRHAGATAAYLATRDLRAVQMFLGHASMATTQKYIHLDQEALRAASIATVLKVA